MQNNPLPDAALAELDRLFDRRRECNKDAAKWAQSISICYRPLRQRLTDAESRLAEVERERDELREVILNYRRKVHVLHQHNQWFERCESGWCNPSPKRTEFDENDPAGLWEALGGMIDNASSRDAQQRREGAAEWLEKFLAEWDTDATRDLVSIWDIQQAAKRLREGK